MSDSEFSRKIALKHLLGDTSKQIDYIKEELVSCLAANEAYIDFPGEEVGVYRFRKTSRRSLWIKSS
ncbi:MAG: hypothetical protein JST59_03010 [Actinobacteria bacterium]|nr:hypothetical protein [Actinomycetota bacterium]